MVPLLNELNCLESCIEIYCCGYKYKTNTASECSNYVVVVVFGLNLWLLVNLMTEKYQFLTVVHFVFTFVRLKMIDCRVAVQSCWQKQIVLLCRSAKTFIPPYKDLCSILETPPTVRSPVRGTVCNSILSSHKLQLPFPVFENADKPFLDDCCPNLLIKENIALTPCQGESLDPCFWILMPF